MRIVVGFALMIAGATASCSQQPRKIDIDFNNMAEPTDEELARYKKERKAAAQRFNVNARQVNERVKAAYLKGVEVCTNLKKAGYPDGNGCPRPPPDYVEIWDESGILPGPNPR